MKIKKIISIFTFVLLSVTMIAPAFANGVTYESDLIAGQYNMVGLLTITFNGPHTEMTIEYDTTGTGCSIVETHLWFGTSLEDVPRTGNGNPKIGKFPYATYEAAGTTVVTYVVPVTAVQTYYVLAHAVVDCPCLGIETAWGEGDWATKFADNQAIFGSRWGYYLEILV